MILRILYFKWVNKFHFIFWFFLHYYYYYKAYENNLLPWSCGDSPNAWTTGPGQHHLIYGNLHLYTEPCPSCQLPSQSSPTYSPNSLFYSPPISSQPQSSVSTTPDSGKKGRSPLNLFKRRSVPTGMMENSNNNRKISLSQNNAKNCGDIQHHHTSSFISRNQNNNVGNGQTGQELTNLSCMQNSCSHHNSVTLSGSSITTQSLLAIPSYDNAIIKFRNTINQEPPHHHQQRRYHSSYQYHGLLSPNNTSPTFYQSKPPSRYVFLILQIPLVWSYFKLYNLTLLNYFYLF